MIRMALILVAAGGMAISCGAQVMGARELLATGQIQGAAGSAAKADIYYFAGEMGAKETYLLTIKGSASITLFARNGQEIISEEGSGSIRLEAVLPYTDVYTIAIARKVPAQLYTISRRATVPTLTEAAIAEGVGFEASYIDKSGKEVPYQRCWITPGVKARITYPHLTEEVTIAADRTTALYVAKNQTRTSAGEFTYRIDGSDIVRMVKPATGKSFEVPYIFAPILEVSDASRITGYYCPDATSAR